MYTGNEYEPKRKCKTQNVDCSTIMDSEFIAQCNAMKLKTRDRMEREKKAHIENHHQSVLFIFLYLFIRLNLITLRAKAQK